MDSPKRVRRMSLNSLSPSSNSAPPPPASPVDRFIPRRRSIDANVQAFFLSESNSENVDATAGPIASNSGADFDAALRAALLSSPSLPKPAALSSHSENFGSPRRRSLIEPGSPTGRMGSRVLNFSPFDEPDSPVTVRNTPGSPVATTPDRSNARLTRSIPSAPTRILDAPDIVSNCTTTHRTLINCCIRLCVL